MKFDIVIVGGGAGGLELASRLGRSVGPDTGRSVLLVDRTPTHIWKPTLHEVAAGTLDVGQEALSYPDLARRNHFAYALGSLAAIDATHRHITLAAAADEHGDEVLPRRELAYGELVLALGSGSSFFGTPGAEHAHVLENTADAERFHRALLIAFTRAAYTEFRRVRLCVVGAGATGVELCAELREAHREILQSVAPKNHFEFEITLIEADDRVLSALSPDLSAKAAAALKRDGVRVRTGTRVQSLRAGAVLTDQGTVEADLIVWAAGIEAASANAGYGLTVNKRHQFVVDDRLRTSAPQVRALGDCAACPWVDGCTVPARAQAASQQATYLAKVLQENGGEAPPFNYVDRGSLVSLGEHRAVGTLAGLITRHDWLVGGLLARAMYMSLHLDHHRVVLGLIPTAVLALARLLRQRVSGRVKMH
ncbi:MAG: FAD-dependent oxidoreductase [Rubrivivax sp.]